MVSWLVRLSCCVCLVGLVACSTKPPVSMPGLDIPAGDPLLASPAMALWEQASQARTEGRLSAASRLLERAVTLEPESSWLYRELAELRLRQDQAAAAEGLARKALRLAPENFLYRSALWQLVATARLRQGDEAGADKARLEADMMLRRVP